MRVFKSLIGLLKIIGYRKASRCGKLQEALPKSPWLGNPLGLSVVSNVPFAIEKINVAGRSAASPPPLIQMAPFRAVSA